MNYISMNNVSMNYVSINNLPDELIMHLCSFLLNEDKLNIELSIEIYFFKQTSKRINGVINDYVKNKYVFDLYLYESVGCHACYYEYYNILQWLRDFSNDLMCNTKMMNIIVSKNKMNVLKWFIDNNYELLITEQISEKSLMYDDCVILKWLINNNYSIVPSNIKTYNLSMEKINMLNDETIYNHVDLLDNAVKYGNLNIVIKLYEMNKIKMASCLEKSCFYHQHEIFKWCITKCKRKDITNKISYAYHTNNVIALKWFNQFGYDINTNVNNTLLLYFHNFDALIYSNKKININLELFENIYINHDILTFLINNKYDISEYKNYIIENNRYRSQFGVIEYLECKKILCDIHLNVELLNYGKKHNYEIIFDLNKIENCKILDWFITNNYPVIFNNNIIELLMEDIYYFEKYIKLLPITENIIIYTINDLNIRALDIIRINNKMIINDHVIEHAYRISKLIIWYWFEKYYNSSITKYILSKNKISNLSISWLNKKNISLNNIICSERKNLHTLVILKKHNNINYLLDCYQDADTIKWLFENNLLHNFKLTDNNIKSWYYKKTNANTLFTFFITIVILLIIDNIFY